LHTHRLQDPFAGAYPLPRHELKFSLLPGWGSRVTMYLKVDGMFLFSRCQRDWHPVQRLPLGAGQPRSQRRINLHRYLHRLGDRRFNPNHAWRGPDGHVLGRRVHTDFGFREFWDRPTPRPQMTTSRAEPENASRGRSRSRRTTLDREPHWTEPSRMSRRRATPGTVRALRQASA